MARNITTDLAEQFTAESLRPYMACHITFPDANGDDQVHKMWTGDYSLTVGSDTYDGLGNLLQISDVSENSDLGASGITITLVATPEFIQVLRDRKYQGKKVEAFLGALFPDSSASKGHFKFFEGFADQLLFKQGDKMVTVTLTAENKLIRLSKNSNRYYTSADQRTFASTDKGLDFINAIQEREVIWGA